MKGRIDVEGIDESIIIDAFISRVKLDSPIHNSLIKSPRTIENEVIAVSLKYISLVQE